MREFKACAVVPTYDNPDTVGDVVRRLGAVLPVIVVDDGSAAPGREAVARLAREGLATVVHRRENGGKGAAVRVGLEVARAEGFTHALQVDADGQHDLDDVRMFLDNARQCPRALVLGRPVFDETAPADRLIGRQIARFWTNVETFGRVIDDPMCGFRVYPLEPSCDVARACGDRMDFDIEIAVRMVWRGAPVINLPTKVRYFEGGVSHYRKVRDNILIIWMHVRLVFGSLWLAARGRVGAEDA